MAILFAMSKGMQIPEFQAKYILVLSFVVDKHIIFSHCCFWQRFIRVKFGITVSFAYSKNILWTKTLISQNFCMGFTFQEYKRPRNNNIHWRSPIRIVPKLIQNCFVIPNFLDCTNANAISLDCNLVKTPGPPLSSPSNSISH